MWCFSRPRARQFYRETMGWQVNSDIPENVAIISITASTEEIQLGYLGGPEPHWFEEADNVLNLNFDDIPGDTLEYSGFTFTGLTMEDARRAVDFIVRNINKDIYVNCRAGKSRSQAFVRFVLDCFPDRQTEINPGNPPETSNIDVLCKLKRVYRYEYGENP